MNGPRVSPFRLKKFFAYKRNKANGSVSLVFHYFTIKFHFSFFASFRIFSLQIFRFASLW
jgi:hypothetical protein